MAEQPSELTMAAIRMAQHILEARRARAAENAEQRGKMQLVKSDRSDAA